MAKNGTEFSKYAKAFHKIIDGEKTNIDIFTKDLLKMGLTDNDKAYIDGEFPTFKDDKGVRHITDNKGDTLRKYFGGTNDLSRLIPKLETEFDSDFHERYCDELQDYEESKIIEFAHSLHLAEETNDIDEILKAIAEYYSSIMINVTANKGLKLDKSKGKPKSDEKDIISSYTIKDEEKQAVYNICKAIQAKLKQLQSQVDYISSNQCKIGKLTDSDSDKLQKLHREGFIESKTNKFNETYSEFVSLCAELNTILAPKKKMNKSFAKLISITSIISSDEYKEISYEQYITAEFSVVISELSTYIKYSICEIDMQ